MWSATQAVRARIEQGLALPPDVETPPQVVRIEPRGPLAYVFARGCGRDVLQIGAGRGRDLTQWVGQGAHTVCVDRREVGVRRAREQLADAGLSAQLRQGEPEHLPFGDAAFDIVYSRTALHHSPDPRRAVRQMHRVARPGGTVVVALLRASWRDTVGRWLRSGRPRHRGRPGVRSFTEQEARALFADFRGLTVQPMPGDEETLLVEATR